MLRELLGAEASWSLVGNGSRARREPPAVVLENFLRVAFAPTLEPPTQGSAVLRRTDSGETSFLSVCLTPAAWTYGRPPGESPQPLPRVGRSVWSWSVVPTENDRLSSEVEERTEVDGGKVTHVKITRTFTRDGLVAQSREELPPSADTGERRRVDDLRTAVAAVAGVPANVGARNAPRFEGWSIPQPQSLAPPPEKQPKEVVRRLMLEARLYWQGHCGPFSKRFADALPGLVQDHGLGRLIEAMQVAKARWPHAPPDALTAHFLRVLREWRASESPEGQQHEEHQEPEGEL